MSGRSAEDHKCSTSLTSRIREGRVGEGPAWDLYKPAAGPSPALPRGYAGEGERFWFLFIRQN